ncbi:MAG: peptide ABC transporter permease [Nitrospinae bacterium CG11_big_fil_rev_8_21_14_0_20_45_15]|nr:MAG: peptide ABC transporter permease [Nitrospinae bacterium CG11_big_fil_rev_8_21_14_0_20_45_15]
MLRFIFNSVGQRVVLLIFISFISHAIIHLAPGEPSLVDPSNPRLKPEDIQKIRSAFHLDDPLHVQYFYWARDLISGDLKSFKDNQPVLAKIWERFLNSFPLFLVATILTWTLAFPLGVRSALTQGSVFDKVSTFMSYALISIPGFFLSYICIIVMVKQFHFPVIGMKTFGLENAGTMVSIMDRLEHIALPAFMSAMGGIAILSRYVRSQMLETLNQDYIRTARAKGLSEDTVVYHHGLRNALLPFITLFGLMIPGLIGGSVIFETIFAWPGMGRLGYEAILSRDFPIILTLNFFAAALALVGTLISDILYAVVDPRIKL